LSRRYLSQKNKAFWLSIALVLVFAIGIGDYLTGTEISFAFFYLAPVSIAAWYCGRKEAYILSVLAAAIWQAANFLAGQRFTTSFILYWNTATRFGFFIVITLLLTRLRYSLDNERELSRIDPLTSVYNLRAFEYIASTEIKRAVRTGSPFTIVYMDLDDFKKINDEFGHSVGDSVLQTVGRIVLLNIRRTDVVARVGGDEFVVLLPETAAEGGKVVVEKLRKLLCNEMESNGWKCGLSQGAVTFHASPGTVRHMIEAADTTMYKAKRRGKNQIEYLQINEATSLPT